MGARRHSGDVVAAVDARLPAAPAARQRLLDAPPGLDNPYWVDDPDFDVEFHVRPLTLPAPGDWAALCDRISRVISRPLDMRRPPWELHVIEGLNGLPGAPAAAYAMLFKIHHVAVDTREGFELINALTSVDLRASQHMPVALPWPRQPLPSPIAWLRHRLAVLPRRLLDPTMPLKRGLPALARIGTRLAGSLGGHSATGIPHTRFSGTAAPRRHVDAVVFEFADVQRVREQLRHYVAGVNINDVALATIGGGCAAI